MSIEWKKRWKRKKNGHRVCSVYGRMYRYRQKEREHKLNHMEVSVHCMYGECMYGWHIQYWYLSRIECICQLHIQMDYVRYADKYNGLKLHDLNDKESAFATISEEFFNFISIMYSILVLYSFASLFGNPKIFHQAIFVVGLCQWLSAPHIPLQSYGYNDVQKFYKHLHTKQNL